MCIRDSRNLIKGTFFGNVFKMAAPAGITTFISVSSLVVFGQVFDIDAACISTSCTMLVGMVGFMILAKVAKPDTPLHIALIAVMPVSYTHLFCDQVHKRGTETRRMLSMSPVLYRPAEVHQPWWTC